MNGVSLRVARGTIHALIGPNGAGKTTCFNLLTKFLPPTRGRITFKGQDITGLPPTEIARLGLVRSFQISAVFPHLTVRENVRIACSASAAARSISGIRRACSTNTMTARWRCSATSACATIANLTAVELPYGRKRALELATTIALDPEMLLLDEPTAGMGHEDIDRIAALIKSVAANRTVLMVEHNLSVVENLCQPHHRADARARAGGGRLRDCLEQSGSARSLHGGRPCLIRPAARRCSPSKACSPGTASRTSCTA